MFQIANGPENYTALPDSVSNTAPAKPCIEF